MPIPEYGLQDLKAWLRCAERRKNPAQVIEQEISCPIYCIVHGLIKVENVVQYVKIEVKQHRFKDVSKIA